MDTSSQGSPETTQEQNVAEMPVLGKGFRIGEYVIDDVLGHGAMATVFLARDRTGHEVALKVFQEGPGVSATMLERFRREAEASKKLRRHPHIMTIYATGKEGPYQYIAMETIQRSKTLEAALESTPMSLNAIVEVVIKIARALQYAHQRHIVHRDVKPTNIMIDEFGAPLLADFGVAELIDWPSCTMTGALTGTPLYMSPEQARGERVGPASDIYSLGVVLYEAVSGVLPYHAHHRSRVKEVLEAVKNEPPRRPRLFRKEITPDLEAVILKALEKNPGDRYPDAEAFAVDLERALAGKKVSAHHFSPLDRVKHLYRRHKQTIMVGLAVALLGTGLNALFSMRLRQARFQGLLHLAQLRHVEHALKRVTEGREPVRDVPQAWHQIRKGRKEMLSGNWENGCAAFGNAAALSLAVGDHRTAAIAQLETARCSIMRNDPERAEELYRGILANVELTPVLHGLAQMEYITFLLLEDRARDVVTALIEYDLPDPGMIQAAIRCLAGELAPEDLEAEVDRMPRRFRNDALLSVAVRYHLDGNDGKCAMALRECLAQSAPSMEWPAPLARRLRSEWE